MTTGQGGPRDYQLARDRSRRQIRTPARYAHANTVSFAFNVVDEVENRDPLSYSKAVACKEKEKWKRAMDEEMESLLMNETWILVDKPN